MLYDMTSGDQFRGSGANWPSQQTVFYNSTYGAFPLFHDRGNPPGLFSTRGSLFSPSGPLLNTSNLRGPLGDAPQSSSLQRFMENPEVIRPYLTPKLHFGLDVPQILPGVPSPYMDRELAHLELMTKSLIESRPSYLSPSKETVEDQLHRSTISEEKESHKLCDIVFIKKERGANREYEISNNVAKFEGTINSDIDQKIKETDFDAGDIQLNDRSMNMVSQTVIDQSRRKEKDSSMLPTNRETKYSFSGGDSNAWNNNEKCNIDVIDLSLNGSMKNKKKIEGLSLKRESPNEDCVNPHDNKSSDATKSDKERLTYIQEIGRESPGCSRTSAVKAKNVTLRRHNPNQEVPSVSIKNEPTGFHQYMPSPSPFITHDPLPVRDIFHPSRLDILNKCAYVPPESSGTASTPLEHSFLNNGLNPCHFGNLPLGNQFPNTNLDVNRWTDKTFINPFQHGSATSSTSTLLSSSTFSFSDQLRVKQEASAIGSVTTSNSSTIDSREQSFSCSRQPSSDSSDNVDFRLPPVGFELLRDPVTGKYLLIPAASIEALQRALFWPGYQPPTLLPLTNGESLKTTLTQIKEENCDVLVDSNQTQGEERKDPQTQVTRNWLLEKAVKEEVVNPTNAVDVSGLELLSRGIEKIEREAEPCKDNMTGLGLLCALAEQRMKDELDDSSSKADSVAVEHLPVPVEKNDAEDGEITEDDTVRPKKISMRRGELSLSPNEPVIRRQDMSPPILEKETDISGMEENQPLKEEGKSDPPTLSPNMDEVKPVFSVKQEDDEEVENEDGKKRLTEENYGRKRKIVQVNAIATGKRKKVMKSRNTTGKGAKLKELELTRSEYLFRPIEPVKPWTESNESICSRISEKLSSFEIVHSETSDSSSEAFLRPTRKMRSRSSIGTDGKNKKQGKLILKLRREKRLSQPEDTTRSTNGSRTCILNVENLMTDRFPIRILTVDGGLFYTGQLSAIQPPDVYGITIDGERGNRPHIYSREEILTNSILEIKPKSIEDLKPGTRICAYWSGQYRCLYPGSVSASSTPDPEPDSVSVEFDDGDSCRISVNDIRLLPEKYPIVEYDPNPLLSLTKKKRRGKLDEKQEKSRNCSLDNYIDGDREVVKVEQEPVVDMPGIKADTKLLKKIKREKKKLNSEYNAENWSQKHRKKHKKHKHKHGKKHRIEKCVEDKNISCENMTPDRNKTVDRVVTRKKNKLKKNEKSECYSVSPRGGGVLFGRRLWRWSGKGFRRAGVKGKARKEYYRAIQRGDERIMIGECAVFLSTGRPDRPFIGRIESMWETWGANMVVRVKWFYHPEETVGCPATLEYPGALFESPHSDENDVQTISHKCEVLPLKRYIEKVGKGAKHYEGNTTLFYLAGFYDPTNTSLNFQEGVK